MVIDDVLVNITNSSPIASPYTGEITLINDGGGAQIPFLSSANVTLTCSSENSDFPATSVFGWYNDWKIDTGATLPQWVQLQFTKPGFVGSVHLSANYNIDGTYFSGIVEGSNDGSSWTTLATFLVNSLLTLSIPRNNYTYYRITIQDSDATDPSTIGIVIVPFHNSTEDEFAITANNTLLDSNSFTSVRNQTITLYDSEGSANTYLALGSNGLSLTGPSVGANVICRSDITIDCGQPEYVRGVRFNAQCQFGLKVFDNTSPFYVASNGDDLYSMIVSGSTDNTTFTELLRIPLVIDHTHPSIWYHGSLTGNTSYQQYRFSYPNESREAATISQLSLFVDGTFPTFIGSGFSSAKNYNNSFSLPFPTLKIIDDIIKFDTPPKVGRFMFSAVPFLDSSRPLVIAYDDDSVLNTTFTLYISNLNEDEWREIPITGKPTTGTRFSTFTPDTSSSSYTDDLVDGMSYTSQQNVYIFDTGEIDLSFLNDTVLKFVVKTNQGGLNFAFHNFYVRGGEYE
jgi:hypothetical protein